jgi:hypothetical protein
MKKIEKASDETIKIFDKVRNSKSIDNWIEFEVGSNGDQKQLYKIKKVNDDGEYLLNEFAKSHVDFLIVVNEEIFDQLPEDQKIMVFEECLTGVHKSEKDALSIKKPTFNTYFGMFEKYHNNVVTLHETIKTLFDEKKQKEDQEKNEAKMKVKKSKK